MLSLKLGCGKLPCLESLAIERESFLLLLIVHCNIITTRQKFGICCKESEQPPKKHQKIRLSTCTSVVLANNLMVYLVTNSFQKEQETYLMLDVKMRP